MKIKRVESFKPFLKAKDINDKKPVTIESIRLATLRSGETYVVKFKEYEYELPLNKTNLDKLIKIFGDETDEWIGKTVKLYKVIVNNPKTMEEVESIRIRETRDII